MAMNKIFNRSRPLLLKTLNPIFFKPISTSPFLSQQPQYLISDPPTPPFEPTHISSDNRRNSSGLTQSLVPLEFVKPRELMLKEMAESLDLEGIKEMFADWMTMQRWDDMIDMFEVWVSGYDKNGNPKKPDLDLFNHYLRANLMKRKSPDRMLDLLMMIQGYNLKANTASFNLILKSMHEHRERDAAVNLLDKMIVDEKNYSKPDEESFDLVIGMLLPSSTYQISQRQRMETAHKYIDLNLKFGYSMSQEVFTKCMWNFMNFESLDTLVSIIEKCKKMDQNEALVADWKLCLEMVDQAMKADNSELAFYALEFMAKWMIKDENMRPPRYLFVEEGLVVSLLATAGRTYSKKLLDAAWSILKRSQRQKVASAETYIAKVASAETYIAKIHAHASLGHQKKALETLLQFESLYGGSDKQAEEDLFSPFTALYPLVVACSHNGCETLDSVYYLLEGWSKKSPPCKSVAALNCIILGCANIWDAERAYQTFESISTTFGLTPDINSYNSLICAFGKLNEGEKARDKALEIFKQLKGLGIKPNAMTYALLVDVHLLASKPISALAVIDEMVISGFTPTKEILKKVRRRCVRKMDDESNAQVGALAKNFGIRMGAENRRDLLFKLHYSVDYMQES
ncbi:Pentatricopeptide repeat-containing protein [Heracleum sosnowskyi]|uniref:Pentatricopeptide repeat-containing protein n=1 Tax=Heracleum sosnowskyi TaxID=360622 RepID=A0AAD8I6E0_9APIA|nr:Pentatricopeptide repeat-containing protein [Heracleum sosnowskyi]